MNKYWSITVIKMSISLTNSAQQTINNLWEINPMNEQQLLQHQALLVSEVIEDSVEHICNENMISGEKVWVMIGALSDYKLKEFPIDEED